MPPIMKLIGAGTHLFLFCLVLRSERLWTKFGRFNCQTVEVSDKRRAESAATATNH